MYLKVKPGEWRPRSSGPLWTIRKILRVPFQGLGLGQPPASNTKCVSDFSKLKLFPHFHIRKSPLISGVPGNGSIVIKWLVSGAPVQMAPQFMNPGFLDPATGTVRADPRLNQSLKTVTDDLLANNPPFDKEPYRTFVRNGAKIRVALVDLTTDAKLVFPQLAEFKSTVQTRAASLAKISALYAAHQMRFDLNHEARQNPAAMTPGRLAGLRKIFDTTQVSGAPPVWSFDFNQTLKQALSDLCHNCSASRVIGRLGTTYISSVLRQSGLYDCRLGGLWIGSTYANPEEIRTECPDVAQLNAQLAHRRDPIGSLFHGVTALSAAAFFTLLAQGRLVDDAACRSMKSMLLRQKSSCPSRFETGLTNAGLAVDSDKVFSKIGVLPSRVYCADVKPCCDQPPSIRSKNCECTCFIHEAALIERVHGTRRLRYVVAVLTESKPGDRANDLLIDIIVKLDELIRKNNP